MNDRELGETKQTILYKVYHATGRLRESNMRQVFVLYGEILYGEMLSREEVVAPFAVNQNLVKSTAAL
jgi:hypothetical protein